MSRKPYEFHPDCLERGDYAFILQTGEGEGLVLAGMEYVRQRMEQGIEEIETVVLTPPEGKTVEQVLADLDKSLGDVRGFLWSRG